LTPVGFPPLERAADDNLTPRLAPPLRDRRSVVND
jgi:hypothetical protein